jgi:hypothetical protein
MRDGHVRSPAARAAAKEAASFDDPDLVSRAGLVPVMALAQRCGLAAWPAGTLRTPARPG